jgi:hypothetical protein
MGVLLSECVVFIDRPLCDLPSGKRYRLEPIVLRACGSSGPILACRRHSGLRARASRFCGVLLAWA